MDGRMNRRRLRNLLIHPAFQLRLALSNLAFFLAVVLILVVSLLCTFYLDVQGSNDLWARYASAELLWRVFARFGTAILLILVISGIYHIVFSHRLCGPLVNISNTVNKVIEGDVTRKVFLRRTDFLKQEAALMNTMLLKLDERICSLKQVHSEMLSVVVKMPQGRDGDRLRELLDNQERILDSWTVSSSAFK